MKGLDACITRLNENEEWVIEDYWAEDYITPILDE